MTTPSAEGPEQPPVPDAANVSAIAAGAIGLALTVGALALFGTRTALSVGTGATVAVVNLVTMSAIVRRVLQSGEDVPVESAAPQPALDLDADLDAQANAELAADQEAKPEDLVDHAAEGKRGGAAWGAFGLAKIIFLFGGFYLLLSRGMVDPMPLVVGYGVLPLAIATSSLLTSLSPRSKRPARRLGPTGRRK